MDLDKLHQKLIAVARASAPREDVPYAFEKRIVARLRSYRPDHWAMWSAALWRAVAPCIAVMLLFAAWSFLSPQPRPQTGDLSQEIENTLLAAVDQDQTLEPSW